MDGMPLIRFGPLLSLSLSLMCIFIVNFKAGHHGQFQFRILTSELYESIGHLVGLFGGGLSPMQGLYLHGTTRHRNTQTRINVPSGIRTRDRIVRGVED